ncbi:hypothetical protein NEOC84_001193|nr:hypothetical protein [Neochlamydia sp. AcF84]
MSYSLCPPCFIKSFLLSREASFRLLAMQAKFFEAHLYTFFHQYNKNFFKEKYRQLFFLTFSLRRKSFYKGSKERDYPLLSFFI